MRGPKNQMLGTMEPPPLMQLSVNAIFVFCQFKPMLGIFPYDTHGSFQTLMAEPSRTVARAFMIWYHDRTHSGLKSPMTLWQRWRSSSQACQEKLSIVKDVLDNLFSCQKHIIML